MDTQEASVLPVQDGYPVFMGRITGLWLILVFIALWVMGQLPHQLAANSSGWLSSSLSGQLATIVPSTITILFMIIPSRKLAIICLLSMVFLLVSYHGRNTALILSIFPLAYLPFIVKTVEFRNALKWTYRLMLLSFLCTIPVISISYTAIPAYSLLANALIPWQRVFVSFVERFEPK